MAISNGTNVLHRENGIQKSAVLHRDLHHDFPEVVQGEGNYLILKDGRKVFDASGGAAVACVGVSFSTFLFACVEGVIFLLSFPFLIIKLTPEESMAMLGSTRP